MDPSEGKTLKDNKKNMYKDLAILRRDLNVHFAKPENRPIEFTDEYGNEFLKGFNKDHNRYYIMPLHAPKKEMVPNNISDLDPVAHDPFGID
jgi:hypothetical protein